MQKENMREIGPQQQSGLMQRIQTPFRNYMDRTSDYMGKRYFSHAMTIVGYNNEGFIIRNSWGEDWGNKGYTIYKYDDWSSHWEIWSTVDKKDIFPEPDFDSDEYSDFDSDDEYEHNIDCLGILKKIFRSW